jgi:chromosome segregation ATPase
MNINVKKYTKDQMAKMVEEAAERQEAAEAEAAAHFKDGVKLAEENEKLRGEIGTLTEKLNQMNGEAITRENAIANLKADLDSAKNTAQYLNDQGQQYWRAWQASKREVADLKNKLNDAEVALGRANAELTDSVAEKNALRNDVTKMTHRAAFELGRANYAESHPWRNLWAWVKRKLKMA